jgi:hypothetical protein
MMISVFLKYIGEGILSTRSTSASGSDIRGESMSTYLTTGGLELKACLI